MDDSPRNEIEEKLLALQAGQIGPEVFMTEVMDMQVFMPVQEAGGAIGGFDTGKDQAVPMVLESDDGQKVVILFTSPERSKDFVAQFAGFDGGFLAELRWVLERVGPGFGISINPDVDLGLDLDAQQLASLWSEEPRG